MMHIAQAVLFDLPTTTASPACACGAPAIGKRTIGGEAAHRCALCALRAEEEDLKAQLEDQYIALVFDASHGPRHEIAWAGDTAGYYTYDAACARIVAASRTPPTPRPRAPRARTPAGWAIWLALGEALRHDPHALLLACRAALDAVVAAPSLETDVWDSLSARVGEAERAGVVEVEL